MDDEGGDDAGASAGGGGGGSGALALFPAGDPYPQVVKTTTGVPRALRFRDNLVSLVVTAGDDSAVAVEAVHAAAANALARVWRVAGLPLGDAVPPYACGVHYATGRDEALLSGAAAAAAFGDTDDGAVGGRLACFAVALPRARTLAEVLLVSDETPAAGGGGGSGGGSGGAPAGGSTSSGYGRNGLQRWFMAHLFNSVDGSGSDAFGAGRGGAGTDSSGGGGGGGQYAAIVKTFMLSLAGAVVTSYVLALGERRPADLLLAPSGHVQLVSLGFAEAGPDLALHHLHHHLAQPQPQSPSSPGEGDAAAAAAARPTARFAARGVLLELLAAIGAGATPSAAANPGGTGGGSGLMLSPLAGQLLTACLDAFMAARGAAPELMAALAAQAVSCSRV
jgi:hypothetical protein